MLSAHTKIIKLRLKSIGKIGIGVALSQNLNAGLNEANLLSL